ncbi:hypothetical protein cand_033980 [Cryptosporidium andersoni]|uniref:Uncharacterized protein n=1 Tax=Cryptosporidium andersoni TaxID=117008 RepID=A0A1J4MZ15_9CRYT|nr:hypothetical protein cand_033980 [Cryptosporidium andersoni]
MNKSLNTESEGLVPTKLKESSTLRTENKGLSIYEELFGTKENPTVIPFPSIIKNPKIYFPLIAITASLTAGHIQNPDAVRELFFRCGGFSYDPDIIESGKAIVYINNIIAAATGVAFLGNFIAGSIVDYFGLLPSAILGHILCILGICFGLALSNTFASRSRFMQMFPKVKNSVGMCLTVGMDFALIIPVIQDVICEYTNMSKMVIFFMILLQLIIAIHHYFIFPSGSLPTQMERKYPLHNQTNILEIGESNTLLEGNTDKLDGDPDLSNAGIPGYRELYWVRKLFTLPFISFFLYMFFLILSRMHYQFFFRSTCIINISDFNSAKKAARFGSIAYSISSSLSVLWGYIVDYNGVVIAIFYQSILISLAFFLIGFKSVSNIIPQVISNVFAGFYTCFAVALTYSFVAEVFGYNNFGLVQGFACLSPLICMYSMDLWQTLLRGPLINNDINIANYIFLYCALIIVTITAILSFLKRGRTKC